MSGFFLIYFSAWGYLMHALQNTVLENTLWLTFTTTGTYVIIIFLLFHVDKPEINFTSDPSTTDCLEVSTNSNFTRCVVAEGNMVHLHCAADSNPAPASFRWRGNGVDTNTSELMIPSANHTVHNGDYNCTVITKQENNDSRLPLASSALLRIIVGCKYAVCVNLSIDFGLIHTQYNCTYTLSFIK